MTKLRVLTAWFVVIVMSLPLSLNMQAGDTDSIPCANPTYRFSYKQLITPGTMLAVGIAGNYMFNGFRNGVQGTLTGSHANTCKVDEYIQFLPAAAYLTVGFIPGLEHRYGFKERLLGGVSAFVVATALTEGLKTAFHRQRPDGSGNDSFPSGHTARAFTGAELMRIEYGNLVGLAGYTCAIATGILRIHNNRHWWSDVLGGAAIGIISARIAYWLLPWERRLFGLDKKHSSTPKSEVSSLPTVVVAPTLVTGGAGISVNYTF